MCIYTYMCVVDRGREREIVYRIANYVKFMIIYLCIYIYIYTHIHTYIHAYIYLYVGTIWEWGLPSARSVPRVEG